jgi:hypothetical protein
MADGSDRTPTARVEQANAEKAESDAISSAIAARTAEREEQEAASDLAVERRKAEQRKAIAEAEKAARDASVAIDPALERKKIEAEARKATAEAEKAAADARRAEITALLPDFSKIAAPETKVTGDQPLFSSVLAHRALDKAATRLVEAVKGKLATGTDNVILLTGEEDLATSDAAYVEVNGGLDHLITSAMTILKPPKDTGFAPVAALGAIATALPGLVSLLMPRRAISSHAIELDTAAAKAVVAGKLADEGHNVRMDDFRLVPTGQIVAREAELRACRNALAARKLEREVEKAEHDTLRSEHQRRLEELMLKRAELPAGAAANPTLDEEILKARSERDMAANDGKQASIEVGLIDGLLTAIDSFSVAIHTVSQGGRRSPFVTAALFEELRISKTDTPRFSRVLLVKASSGSADQLFKDRTFRSDKFEGIASVSVSYSLIDPQTSYVLTAGIAVGSARIQGEMGGTISYRQVEDG